VYYFINAAKAAKVVAEVEAIPIISASDALFPAFLGTMISHPG
jgi:hypothetical protein